MILPEHGTVPPEKTFDQERNRLNLENNPLERVLVRRVNLNLENELLEFELARLMGRPDDQINKPQEPVRITKYPVCHMSYAEP